MRTLETIGGDDLLGGGQELLVAGACAGSWRVEHFLGHGGMGDVYAVVHDRIGKRAAMKVMHRHLALSVNADRAQLEGQVVNHVEHPSIVDIFEAGTFDGRPYLIMERLDGMTLANFAASGKMLPTTVIEILLQLCEPLAAAHAAGVVHRDLKPDNVFLVDSPAKTNALHVKLLDWGVAKVLGDTSRRTREGLLVGTPDYLSPEQACGRPVSTKTDVYALGVIAFELFLEQLPFEATTPLEMLTAHFQLPPQLPRDIWPHIPQRLELLLLAMLAKDPRDRPTMESVQHQLREVDGELAARRVALVALPAPRSSLSRLPRSRWLSGVVVALLGVATIVLCMSQQPVLVEPVMPIVTVPTDPAPSAPF